MKDLQTEIIKEALNVTVFDKIKKLQAAGYNEDQIKTMFVNNMNTIAKNTAGVIVATCNELERRVK